MEIGGRIIGGDRASEERRNGMWRVSFVYFYLAGNRATTGGGGHVYERTREDEEHARHAEISTGTIMSMA